MPNAWVRWCRSTWEQRLNMAYMVLSWHRTTVSPSSPKVVEIWSGSTAAIRRSMVFVAFDGPQKVWVPACSSLDAVVEHLEVERCRPGKNHTFFVTFSFHLELWPGSPAWDKAKPCCRSSCGYNSVVSWKEVGAQQSLGREPGPRRTSPDLFLGTLPDLTDLSVSVSLHFVGRNMSSSICWFMIPRNWNGSTNFLATPIYSWFMYVHKWWSEMSVHKWWSEMSVSNHDSTIQYPFHENCHELSSWWKLNGNYIYVINMVMYCNIM
jgi:hypothetical protein